MRRRGRLGLLVLAAAAVAYALAAWSVAPGFFDGLAPPGQYRWLSPPPQFKQGNQQPLSGHGTAAVGPTGEVEPVTVQTGDNQAALSAIPAAFVTPPSHAPVTIQITPVGQYPNPGNLQLGTNVYCVTSTSPIAAGHDVLITLTYSDGIAAPRFVYGYQTGATTWEKLGSTGTSAPYTISVQVPHLGCFAAASDKTASGGGFSLSGQTLPVLVAILIVLVLLAGLPLVLLRRRHADDEEEGDDENEDRDESDTAAPKQDGSPRRGGSG